MFITMFNIVCGIAMFIILGQYDKYINLIQDSVTIIGMNDFLVYTYNVVEWERMANCLIAIIMVLVIVIFATNVLYFFEQKFES